MRFAELTQVALLGTERQGVPPAMDQTPLGQLQSQIDSSQRERALLSLAALAGLHEQIGRLPAKDNAPLPQPCPAEQQRRVNEHVAAQLLRMLGGDLAELLPEWLALCTRRTFIAPPEALPLLLSAGTAKPELREIVLPVLGERGRWLAAQNPEWSWVAGAASESEIVWQLGEAPARLLFLQRLRSTNPARARELLVSTWQQETPEDRAAFLATFAAGLSPDDERLLESALDDKRKEVRRTASSLLARLPGSALVARHIARVKPLLKFVPGVAGSLLRLKRATPATIEVTLPGECDKAMQRDGVDPKARQGFGEKVGWLIQMLEAVPLDLWTREWNATPAEILAASQQGEWKKEFFEAWTRAAILQRNAVWAEALFDAAIELNHVEKAGALLAAMPAAQREARVSKLLSSGKTQPLDQQGGLLALCSHEWSASFSRAVLAFMRKESGQPSTNWALRSQFKQFAVRLSPEVLAEALAAWPRDSVGWEFWSKGVEEFLAVVQFRADIRAAFKPES